MKSIKRSELYARVWSTPMNRLALELGVSATRLVDDCRRHAIPTPRAGYWSKLAHGAAGATPALPKGEDVEINLEGPRPRTVVVKSPKTFKPARLPISNREASPSTPEPAPVPAEPILLAPSADAHRKTVKTITSLLADRGEGLRHVSGAGRFRVTASAAVIGRVETILSLLVHGVEEIGGKVVEGERGFCLALDHEVLGFELVEQTDRFAYRLTEADLAKKAAWHVRVAAARRTGGWVSSYDAPKFPDWDHRPNGKMSLKLDDAAGYLGVRKTFSDRKSQRVEDLLPLIVETLQAYVAAVSDRKAEQERRRIEAEEAEQVRRKAQKRAELEAKRFEFLDRQLARIEKADRIDAFLRGLPADLEDDSVRRFRDWAFVQSEQLRQAASPEALARKIATTDLMNDEAVISSWIDVETGQYGRG
jgi:hypothetical protein